MPSSLEKQTPLPDDLKKNPDLGFEAPDPGLPLNIYVAALSTEATKTMATMVAKLQGTSKALGANRILGEKTRNALRSASLKNLQQTATALRGHPEDISLWSHIIENNEPYLPTSKGIVETGQNRRNLVVRQFPAGSRVASLPPKTPVQVISAPFSTIEANGHLWGVITSPVRGWVALRYVNPMEIGSISKNTETTPLKPTKVAILPILIRKNDPIDTLQGGKIRPVGKEIPIDSSRAEIKTPNGETWAPLVNNTGWARISTTDENGDPKYYVGYETSKQSSPDTAIVNNTPSNDPKNTSSPDDGLALENEKS
ncbi:MAG: hypothetical protein UT55_C0016G0005 [Candidatus Peregrinibacteria bacterium GW2011_GWE2_39_6]|nr:MAG: hypothetical protein UT36_C0003G0115 [Candidatus Peregrinibacteria bacterium GW2011_GWF2_39_17]KKR26144.1 MAG: hypothetical protein UT55_C0016G0005 [Candidatus Peregrinibacteria bacterium GW2011_GWE2_39_6]HCW32334.1 hypothetical protein [Candidatus Peregrinibacteria bacterium]